MPIGGLLLLADTDVVCVAPLGVLHIHNLGLSIDVLLLIHIHTDLRINLKEKFKNPFLKNHHIFLAKLTF